MGRPGAGVLGQGSALVVVAMVLAGCATAHPTSSPAPDPRTAIVTGTDGAPTPTSTPTADAPAVAGRVAYVGGPAQVWDPRDNAWRQAVLNEAIGPDTEVRTETGSRMEITVGTTAFRLDSNTRLRWDELDPGQTVVDLDSGSLIVNLRDETIRPPADAADANAADPESSLMPVIVEAGTVAVAMTRNGSAAFRVDQDGRRLTVAALAGGGLEIDHDGSRTPLAVGQTMAFDTESGRVEATAATVEPTFRNWSTERDRAVAQSDAYRYVSPAMTGVDALEGHGRWETDPTYGPLWYPTTVAADWAPYRYGRWVWVAPWGWTWVDDAPWGFAPFHYGRWALIGSRWAWVPGEWVARPVYAPALVGYYGGGGGSVTITAGAGPGVGWFPLAPYEPWYPAYGYSSTYLAAVNRPWYGGRYRPAPLPPGRGYLAPPARYYYAQNPAAVTVVPAPRFGAGGPLTGRLPVTADQLRRLPAPVTAPRMPRPPAVGPLPPAAGAGRFRAPSSPAFDRPGAGLPTPVPRWGGPPTGAGADPRRGRVIAPRPGDRFQAPPTMAPLPGRAGPPPARPITPLPNRAAPPPRPMVPLPAMPRASPPPTYSPPNPPMRSAPPASAPMPRGPQMRDRLRGM